jgi:hypothetical protein
MVPITGVVGGSMPAAAAREESPHRHNSARKTADMAMLRKKRRSTPKRESSA